MTVMPNPNIDRIKQQLCEVHHSLLCRHENHNHDRKQQLARLFDVMDAMTAFQPEAIATLIKNDPKISAIEAELRSHCCTAEYELEQLWARHITASDNPRKTLKAFPYYGDYCKLIDFNVSCLSLAGRKPIKNLLFVGSGPLPLSAYLLQQQAKYKVDGLDISHEAVQDSRAFLRALHSPISIIENDILQFRSLGEYDAVFLAALVGSNVAQKRAVFDHLYNTMKPGAILLARTAHQLRTLYYTHVKPEDLLPFRLHAVVQPLNSVVNSVIIAEKP